MKNIGYYIGAFILLVLIAAGLVFTWHKSAVRTPAVKSIGTSEVKAGRALPRVITLYQKGEGESDLAAFVSNELAAKNKGLASFQAVNALDEPEMAEYYGVNSLPAVVFLTSAGKVFSTHEGYLDKAGILKILDSIK